MKKKMCSVAIIVVAMGLTTVGCNRQKVADVEELCQEFDEISKMTDDCDAMMDRIEKISDRYDAFKQWYDDEEKSKGLSEEEKARVKQSFSVCFGALLAIGFGPCGTQTKE